MGKDSDAIEDAEREVKRARRALSAGSPVEFWRRRLDEALGQHREAARILLAQLRAMGRLDGQCSHPDCREEVEPNCLFCRGHEGGFTPDDTGQTARVAYTETQIRAAVAGLLMNGAWSSFEDALLSRLREKARS